MSNFVNRGDNPGTKVVVTGMGIVCCLGNDRKEVLESVQKASGGLKKVKSMNLEKLMTHIGGEVENLPVNSPDGMEDKTSWFSYLAMREAIADSGLNVKDEDPYRCALSFGTCNGNILTLEKIYERGLGDSKEILESVYQRNFLAIDCLNKELNICGAKAVFVTACSASNNAIGYAYDLIMTNQADVVFVGGADSLAKTTFSGFNSLQSLGPEGCAPFSQRVGLALGEGAAFMVVESEEHARQRKAKIHAVILGYGFSADAYHATSPDITGDGAVRTMRAAVESSGIRKEDIAFVCAHGTGTNANDKTETLAIKKYFGQHAKNLFISTTKSMSGHTLGAAGIIQAVISIDCMNHDLIFPIVNFCERRELCDLNYVINKPVKKVYDCFLSNSFAFGGNNVSVVFGKAQNVSLGISTRKNRPKTKIVITGVGDCTPLTRQKSLVDLLKANDILAGGKTLAFDDFVLDNPRFIKYRKTPRLSQFAICAIEKALGDSRYPIKDGTKIGMVFGVAKGPMKTFEKYYEGISSEGMEFASALHFPHIVQNSVSGQSSIAFGIKGCNTTLAGQFSPFAGLQYACELIRQRRNEIFIIGGADEISQFDVVLMREKGYKDLCLSQGAAALTIESFAHAKQRNAQMYAQIDGFSIISSYYEKDFVKSYKTCVQKTLQLTGLRESDIDLHIPCHWRSCLWDILNAVNIQTVSNSQNIVGTLESASAILNIITAIVAFGNDFAPKYGVPNEVYIKNFENILVSGCAINGTYYSFLLKRP